MAANPPLVPKTPALNTKGLYTLVAPFTLTANTIYICRAVRSYADLQDSGVDIFATYYDPLGLTQDAYKADVAAGASMITLMSDKQPTVHVPDTYIANFPDQTNVAYNEVVLAFSFGPLPDYLDLTAVMQSLSDGATAVIGVAPTVTSFVSPSTGVMTRAQADLAEAARQAKITDTSTTVAKLRASQAQVLKLQEQVNAMAKILIDHGLA